MPLSRHFARLILLVGFLRVALQPLPTIHVTPPLPSVMAIPPQMAPRAVEAAVASVYATPEPTPLPLTIVAASAPLAPSGSHEDWLTQAGISSTLWSCAEAIITRESGWNIFATNPASGAYGLPQSLPGEKMAASGADWRTNPVTQLRWMQSYVNASYGGFCGAWSFWQAHSWY